MSEWLKKLNSEQQEAASHIEGPLLILAGAGSGKTTVLVSRTGYLIEKKAARANEILVLTFTNKAARELKERVSVAKTGGLWAGTFHSFGLQILKQHDDRLPKGFGVLDGQDARQVVKDLMRNLRVQAKDGFDVDHLLNLINKLRSDEKIGPDQDEVYTELANVLLPKYEKRLEQLGVVDFESLLLRPLELFDEKPEVLSAYQNKFKQVMVDEFQDTNRIQMKLIDRIVSAHRNITVVGDDDQSIYGWRGAEVRNILDFPKRYKPCRVVKLERNYRSQSAILDVANSIIGANKERHAKTLRAEASYRAAKPEVFVYDSDDVEVEEVVSQIRYFLREGYNPRSIAVLYRSNSQGGLLEGSLRHNQIPYELTGGSELFERTEIKDVLAYLRCSVRPHEVAFRRILNTPTRGVGETTIEQLNTYAKSHKISFIQAAKQWREAGINEKSGEGIEQFFKTLKKLPEVLFATDDIRPVGERLVGYLNDIGYRSYVFQQYKNPQSAQNRWQLVDILGRVLEGFVKKGGLKIQSLRDFLETMDLRDQQEEEEKKDAVQLLTLHASKGLEYPVVILMGVEEEILPHRTLGKDINEERRLFYVGVTRAKERLVLTRARQRKRFGKNQLVAPSRFLKEIPDRLFEIYESGFRPVSEGERKTMLSDFYKKFQPKT